MALTSETTRVQYSGNGATTSFPITFAFWSADDLGVTLTAADGTETTWTRGTQYTVTGGAGSTGTLTVATSPTDYTPASGATLTIVSDLPYTQPTALPRGGAFPSASVEQQLDQTVRQVQQVRTESDRTLRQPVSDAAAIGRLPAAAARASKYLAFDADGEPIASEAPVAGTGTPVSTFAATLLDDADAATARATLDIASSDNAFTADQTISSTDAGATAGPLLKLHRNSASPAASDLLGAVDFQGKNTTPATKSFARLLASIVDATAASEDGLLQFWTIVAGTLAARFHMGQGLYADSLSDPGAGIINALGFKINGTTIPFSKSYTSSDQTITAGGALTLAHGLGAAPTLVQLRLKCIGGEFGYNAGNEVIINPGENGDDTTANRGVSCVVDATNVTIRFGSSASSILILSKDTGARDGITNANWKLIVKAWA